MPPLRLSVIELGPLPHGNLSVSVGVRERALLDAPPSAPALTCLFEEPTDDPLRASLGTAPREATAPPAVRDAATADPGIWLGALTRLTRAGRALATQDVATLVTPVIDADGLWFEVDAFAGTWQRVPAARVQATFDDTQRDALEKPFFVRAAGDAPQVQALLQALCAGARTDDGAR